MFVMRLEGGLERGLENIGCRSGLTGGLKVLKKIASCGCWAFVGRLVRVRESGFVGPLGPGN